MLDCIYYIYLKINIADQGFTLVWTESNVILYFPLCIISPPASIQWKKTVAEERNPQISHRTKKIYCDLRKQVLHLKSS